MTAAPPERAGTVAEPGPAGTVVNQFIAALERRDVDAALALVAEDIVYDNAPMGAVEGVGAVRAALGPFISGAAEVEWLVFRQAEWGGLVMNERLDRFKVADKWVEIPVAGLFEVIAGKIQLWRDYFDLPTFTNQL
jgi:limonene-1,2-epoxide hydrolase